FGGAALRDGGQAPDRLRSAGAQYNDRVIFIRHMNRHITLAARHSGLPTESDFRLVESDMPSPGPGEVLVRTLYLSIDPYMRGRMNDAKSYAAPVQIGQVMVGGTVSRVEKSND